MIKYANMTKEDVISIVAEEYCQSVEDILGESRLQEVADARHMAIFLVDYSFDMTKVDIGAYFSRTHASVISAIKKVRDMLAVDKVTRDHYECAIKRIKQML